MKSEVRFERFEMRPNKKRWLIHSITTGYVEAAQDAASARARVGSARIVPRTVRAAGLSATVYVVLRPALEEQS